MTIKAYLLNSDTIPELQTELGVSYPFLSDMQVHNLARDIETMIVVVPKKCQSTYSVPQYGVVDCMLTADHASGIRHYHQRHNEPGRFWTWEDSIAVNQDQIAELARMCFYEKQEQTFGPDWVDVKYVCRIHKEESKYSVGTGYDKPCLGIDPRG